MFEQSNQGMQLQQTDIGEHLSFDLFLVKKGPVCIRVVHQRHDGVLWPFPKFLLGNGDRFNFIITTRK